jgi:hypothetical protein
VSLGSWIGTLTLKSVCKSYHPDSVVRTVSDVFARLDGGGEVFLGRMKWRLCRTPLTCEKLFQHGDQWIAFFEDDLLIRIGVGEGCGGKTYFNNHVVK